MATLKTSYGTKTAVTIPIASLGSSAGLTIGSESASLNVGTLGVEDLIIGGRFKTGTTSFAAGIIELWAAGSNDDTYFPSGLLGTAAARTVTNKEDLFRVDIVSLTTADTTYILNPTAIARQFGGRLPPYLTFFLTHSTVAALSATPGDHELNYVAVNSATV